MNSIKAFILISLCTILVNCGNSNRKKSKLSINTNATNKTLTIDDTLSLSLNNPEQLNLTSVSYLIDGEDVGETVALKDNKLGIHTITAIVKIEDSEEKLVTDITILNDEQPKIYGYKIINEYPHDMTSYTQGLEFHEGQLYESTGQYKESKLRKVDYKTGEVEKNVDLADQYFAEGITILNDNIYQLTWKENTGFVYNLETFQKTSSFTYGKSKEGWGLCNDNTTIYKSDGTEHIWSLNPETLAETDKIQVYTNKGKIVGLNEMEWIDGKIYANRYQKNGVAIINPKNGAVEGVIDFSPLHKLVKQHAGLDVLNGIAYNPETKTIFVTGKRWDKLFEVEVFEK